MVLLVFFLLGIQVDARGGGGGGGGGGSAGAGAGAGGGSGDGGTSSGSSGSDTLWIALCATIGVIFICLLSACFFFRLQIRSLCLCGGPYDATRGGERAVSRADDHKEDFLRSKESPRSLMTSTPASTEVFKHEAFGNGWINQEVEIGKEGLALQQECSAIFISKLFNSYLSQCATGMHAKISAKFFQSVCRLHVCKSCHVANPHFTCVNFHSTRSPIIILIRIVLAG
jgi:hypothetical protein